MSVEPRHHRHFVSRKADVVRQISDECGAVSIVFPRAGSKSDRVVLKGAKQCVEAARQRILDIVNELVRTDSCGPRVGSAAVRIGPIPFPDLR